MSGGRIITTVHPTGELSPADWDALWILTQEFFTVAREQAEAELRRRGWVAQFRHRGALLGLAALDILTLEVRARPVTVIYTSQVLLREDWRGRNLLQRLGFRLFLRERLRHPLRPIYWFFDTFSYKSYLLLPRNFRDYWPRHDQPTPPDQAQLIDTLARRIHGHTWQPERGIVTRSGQRRLRDTAAPLILARDSPAELQYFARVNPGHLDGDRLVCLCPLTLRNWLQVARQALRRARQRLD